MMNALDTMLGQLMSPNVNAYTKKKELEKLHAELGERKHWDREVDVVRVLTSLTKTPAEELEVRRAASVCLAALVRKGVELSQISLRRLLDCARETTAEALAQESNLKEHPARQVYANALVPVISRCGDMPQARELLRPLAGLLAQTGEGGSITVRRQALLALLRMHAAPAHNAAAAALRGEWLDELGRQLRAERDAQTKRHLLEVLEATNGVCATAEEAERLERLAVRGLAAASSVPDALEGLELCCAAAGPHFLALALAPQSPARALLDEGTAASDERVRGGAWARWCQACLAALRAGPLPLSRVVPVFRRACGDARTATLLAKALLASGGLWERLAAAGLDAERLGELGPPLLDLAHCARGSLHLANELWSKLFKRLLGCEERDRSLVHVLPRELLLAHGPAILCPLAFSGICSVAAEAPAAGGDERDLRTALTDEVSSHLFVGGLCVSSLRSPCL